MTNGTHFWLKLRKGTYPFILVAALYISILLYSAILTPSNGVTVADQHKWLLKHFRTFTVEASYVRTTPENVLGYDANALSDLILKELSERAKKRFGDRISSSRYSRPYSFQTNPLNLGITFTVMRSKYDPSAFHIGASFERSHLFSLLSTSDYNPASRDRLDILLKPNQGRLIDPTVTEGLSIKRVGVATEFKTLDELLAQIDTLSDVIVEDMSPE